VRKQAGVSNPDCIVIEDFSVFLVFLQRNFCVTGEGIIIDLAVSHPQAGAAGFQIDLADMAGQAGAVELNFLVVTGKISSGFSFKKALCPFATPENIKKRDCRNSPSLVTDLIC